MQFHRTADNQAMNRRTRPGVVVRRRQSRVPGYGQRYRTDSADVPRIRLHKRLLQRLVIGASFGICVSDSPIRTS
ncbi:hypothetical protein Poly51_63280 [Rubripirellula tenax]|uniref:Uncharacterized protein n=1 Tax=Rubripirellula tenax TaxID=2528015 RepID=A0A5C6E3V5_9BACT|nr:hypothetical protein Poly51_63280 [Rubripirellula tenax]